MRCPMLEVGAHALFRVVAVDEEDVNWLGRRLGASGIRHVQPHAVCEPVALEDTRELAIELGAITSLTNLDVVGVEHPSLKGSGDDHCAATAKPPDFHDGLGLRVAHETVQEGRLIQPE